MAIQPSAVSGIADYTKARVKLFRGVGQDYASVPASALRDGLQPLDATLTALAALDSSTGILHQTGADTFAKLPYVAPTTFTPTIVGTTAAGVGTYSAQNGIYTRIGDVVTFALTIIWSAHTGTGNMNVGGIPVTPNASYAQIFAAVTGNMTGSTSPILQWTGTAFSIRNAESGATITMDTAASFVASGSFIA